jgi:hypothetical protein
MTADGKMVFIKEAEGALVPVLLEKYGQEAASASTAAARAGRGTGARRDFSAAPLLDHK